MTDRQSETDAFLTAAGWDRTTRHQIAGDASSRSYARLRQADGRCAILMDAPPITGETTRPFTRIARHLLAQGLSAPRIYAEDAEAGFLLLEDLGDRLFARLMEAKPERRRALYTAATDLLLTLHRAPVPELTICDADWLTEMTRPAFEYYATGAEDTAAYDEFAALFHPLATSLDDAPRVLALRDYHAENLIWLPERQGVARVGLLDFQDAVAAHPAYDLVSVLQDARRDVEPEIETAMKRHYLAHSDFDPAAFERAYALLGAQRNLRILGIFARLCQRDGKPHYVDLIPRVWGYLRRNLEHADLREVAACLDRILPTPTQEHLERLRRQCATTLVP